VKPSQAVRPGRHGAETHHPNALGDRPRSANGFPGRRLHDKNSPNEKPTYRQISNLIVQGHQQPEAEPAIEDRPKA